MNLYLASNTSNTDLLDEISTTNNEINNLLKFHYIKEL